MISITFTFFSTGIPACQHTVVQKYKDFLSSCLKSTLHFVCIWTVSSKIARHPVPSSQSSGQDSESCAPQKTNDFTAKISHPTQQDKYCSPAIPPPQALTETEERQEKTACSGHRPTPAIQTGSNGPSRLHCIYKNSCTFV